MHHHEISAKKIFIDREKFLIYLKSSNSSLKFLIIILSEKRFSPPSPKKRLASNRVINFSYLQMHDVLTNLLYLSTNIYIFIYYFLSFLLNFSIYGN